MSFAFVASDGPLDLAVPDDPDPVAAALRMVEVIADLVVAVALSTPAVQDVLDRPVGARTVRQLLAGVVLEDTAAPERGHRRPVRPDTLLARAQRLFENLAGAGLQVTIEGVELSLGRATPPDVIGLNVGLGAGQRMTLFSSDVTLWLENDDRWIDPDPPGERRHLRRCALDEPRSCASGPSWPSTGSACASARRPGRCSTSASRSSRSPSTPSPSSTTPASTGGGVQLQFTNLAVSASGGGGENGIAQGVVRDTGPQPPRPAFSPALAIQKHGNQPVAVTLRAGDGDGPWWIAIQKGFGPLYLEQIGFGVTMPQPAASRASRC